MTGFGTDAALLVFGRHSRSGDSEGSAGFDFETGETSILPSWSWDIIITLPLGCIDVRLELAAKDVEAASVAKRKRASREPCYFRHALVDVDDPSRPVETEVPHLPSVVFGMMLMDLSRILRHAGWWLRPNQ